MSSTIDCILTRRPNLKLVKDSEVIPSESKAAQHIAMVMEYRIRQDKRRKLRTRDRQIRWREIRKEKAKMHTQLHYLINWKVDMDR